MNSFFHMFKQYKTSCSFTIIMQTLLTFNKGNCENINLKKKVTIGIHYRKSLKYLLFALTITKCLHLVLYYFVTINTIIYSLWLIKHDATLP